MKTNLKLIPKKVSETSLETTYLVLPEHTNPMGNIFGGTIMSWVDITASIVAFRHCRTLVVTASMQELSFLHPIKLGHLVTLMASANYVSERSIEVGVKVVGENPVTGEKRHTSSAYLTFVSLDENGKAQQIPPLIPESKEEIQRFEDGKKRREQRLKLKKK